MKNDSATGAPRWVRVVVWSIAVGLAVLGIVLAFVSGSFWPLVAFAGLAIPMFPIGSRRTSGSRSARV